MKEQLLSLKEAARFYPGRTPHHSTVFRHATKGVGGVRLRTIRVGGRRMTSQRAIDEFISTLNAEGVQAVEPSRHSQEVDRELDQIGI